MSTTTSELLALTAEARALIGSTDEPRRTAYLARKRAVLATLQTDQTDPTDRPTPATDQRGTTMTTTTAQHHTYCTRVAGETQAWVPPLLGWR